MPEKDIRNLLIERAKRQTPDFWPGIEKRIKPKSVQHLYTLERRKIYRYGIAAACIILMTAFILTALNDMPQIKRQNIFATKKTLNDGRQDLYSEYDGKNDKETKDAFNKNTEGNQNANTTQKTPAAGGQNKNTVSSGLMMRCFVLYDHKIYKVTNDQVTNAQSYLTGYYNSELYSIKDIDLSQSIAYKINGCYYKADFLLNDTIKWNGSIYTVNPEDFSDKIGSYLSKDGNIGLYSVEGVDTEKEIGIKISDSDSLVMIAQKQ